MFSQTVEYALRAMSCLAALGECGGTNQLISQATHVPQTYLSKVMRDLVRAGLVRSTRGRNGGFYLARPASEISVLDIVNAVDPIRRIVECPLGNPLHVALCPLHRCIDDALDQVEKSFQQARLSSILETACRKGTCSRLFLPQSLTTSSARKGTT